MDRRELFKILGATLITTGNGVAAEHDHMPPHDHSAPHATVDIENYQPRFFSAAEYRDVDRLTDILIPSDEQSPGAHAAGVRYYIDTVLHYGDHAAQERWRNGLAAVNELAHTQFHKSFGECSPQDQERIVQLMARDEKHPATDAERFFGVLKALTIDAYVLSETGMKQYLGYKGNTAIREFRGCTHPEHQTI